MEEKTRIVHTGIKDVGDNLTIIDSVTGQIADGIWENNDKLTSNWMDIDIESENGEIVFKVVDKPQIMYRERYMYYSRACHKHIWDERNKWRNNFYYGKTDLQIKNYFARKLREIVKIEDKDNLDSVEFSKLPPEQKMARGYRADYTCEREDFSWNATNETWSRYLDGTVKDVYEIVKKLKAN